MYFNLEERNYFNDNRVRATRKWFDSFNENTMTAHVDLIDGEGSRTVACTYGVCSTCNGKGSHVNPSIDASGISGEDFDADPDFKEDYLSGAYSVPCYGCGGKRVTPKPSAMPDWLESYLADFSRSGGDY